MKICFSGQTTTSNYRSSSMFTILFKTQFLSTQPKDRRPHQLIRISVNRSFRHQSPHSSKKIEIQTNYSTKRDTQWGAAAQQKGIGRRRRRIKTNAMAACTCKQIFSLLSWWWAARVIPDRRVPITDHANWISVSRLCSSFLPCLPLAPLCVSRFALLSYRLK